MSKNIFGSNITVSIYGESHGGSLGVIIDGLAPGIRVDPTRIASLLSLRRPVGAISTARVEIDEFRIASGVYNGFTTGTPICIDIPNTNTKSGDYAALEGKARPGHADYTANVKYNGFQDSRGGGHFSGRITAALVAAGGILIPALESKGILIGTHIKRCADILDCDFFDLQANIKQLAKMSFPVLNPEAADKMNKEIITAKAAGDSVGGVLETVVIGVPAGLGEPWFDSLESLLSHGLFSIPAVKGVEFGDGFELSKMKGSIANDSFRINKDGKIITVTNHNGGINGGISNGMPIVFRTAIKPTPSIELEQTTVDFVNYQEVSLKINGRHDPFIVHRARPSVDSICALVIADMLSARFGTNYLAEVK